MKDYLELHNKAYYIPYDELLSISNFRDTRFKDLKYIPNLIITILLINKRNLYTQKFTY